MVNQINKLGFFSNPHLIFAIITSLLIIETQQAPVDWQTHEDIRTGRKVWNALLTSSNVPPQITYNITYSSPLTGTRNAGVGITGFETVITNDFSVNTTIENFTVSWMRISVGVLDTTVATHIALNWIAVGDTVDFLQVMFDCFFCSALAVGNQSRQESRTDTTFFQGYNQLFVTVYLAGFRVHNSQGITNYLSASASIAPGTNVIDYLFQTNENNTVISICYTTLVFCEQITKLQTYYYNWGQMGQDEVSNPGSLTPSIFTPDARYTQEDRMFFGMSSFNVSRAQDRKFDMKTQNYGSLGTGYLDNTGTYNIMIDYFWIAVRDCDPANKWFVVQTPLSCQNDNNCPADTYETMPGQFCDGCHYSCQNCSGSHPDNCVTCPMDMFRQNITASFECPCEERYIDVGVKLCHPCEYYMPGCETCASITLCTTCFPGFTLESTGLCGCTSGYLVTGVCTNITGCTSAVQFGGTVYCIACNASMNYQTATTGTYTCACMPAYYLSATQLCLSDCGDGLQASDEGCDDGNTVSGDGCSSACVVEAYWACFNGSTTTSSDCYIYNNFTMTVKYVKRVLSGNIMQVGIKIEPEYDQFTQINFKQLMSHDVPAEDFNATYEEGMLILEFQYTRTIEGENFTATFQFDPDIFYSTAVSVKIPASGMNAKLTYDSNTSIYEPLGIVVAVLAVLAFIVLGASALSERMIGIEMIQTLQSCLFVQMIVKTMPSTLAPLQNLQYSNGYNDMMGDDPARTFTFAFSLSSVGLQKQFLLSFNIMYIILLIVIGINIILKAKQIYHERKAEKIIDDEQFEKNEIKWEKTTKVFYFMFEKVLFVAGFACMFLIFAALMIQITDMSADYSVISQQLNMLGAGVAVAIMGTLICCVIINGIYPPTLLFPMLIKQYYPPIYFIYQSTFIFICCFLYTQQYVLYVLAVMSILFLIYNIIHRPYPQRFHTFVLILHQLIILTVILLLIYEVRTTPAQHQTLYTIAVIAIISVLYLVVFVNAYRLYRYRKFLKDKNWDQYGNDLDEIQENAGLGMGLGAVLANKARHNKYSQLKTPKAEKEEYENRKEKKLRKKEQKQQQQLKRKREKKQKKERKQEQRKRKKKEEKRIKKREQQMKELDEYNKKKKKQPQDETDFKWKVNKMADDDEDRFNRANERAKGTRREAYPDTSREKDNENINDYSKSNKKPNKQLFANEKQHKNNKDDEITEKRRSPKNNEDYDDDSFRRKRNKDDEDGSNSNSNRNRKGEKEMEEESDDWKSPYNEDGNVRSKDEDEVLNSSRQGKQIDPLRLIKMKLKQDFSNKMKGNSSMRES